MEDFILSIKSAAEELYISGKITETQEQDINDHLYEIEQILDEDNEEYNDEDTINQNNFVGGE